MAHSNGFIDIINESLFVLMQRKRCAQAFSVHFDSISRGIFLIAKDPSKDMTLAEKDSWVRLGNM